MKLCHHANGLSEGVRFWGEGESGVLEQSLSDTMSPLLPLQGTKQPYKGVRALTKDYKIH